MGHGREMEHEGGNANLLRRQAATDDVDEVSAMLMKIAEQGRAGQKFTYNGKRVRLVRISSSAYARAVGDMKRHRKQASIQIGARVCQLVGFVITCVAIAFGTWYLAKEFQLVQKQFAFDADEVAQLRPVIPQLTETVKTLDGVVGGLNTGIQTAGQIVSGVENVTSLIGSGAGTELVQDVVQNATQIVGTAVSGLQDAGNQIGDSISDVLSGNATVQEGLRSAGSSFQSLGSDLVSGIRDTGQQIASTASNIFCGALPSVCGNK